MKFMLLSFIINIFLISCEVKSKKIKLSILNESGQTVDSVKVSSYNLDATFINILPNKKYVQEYQITNTVEGKSAFLASVFIRDSIVFQGTFGYHSSFNDIKPFYDITIKSDYSISEK